MRLKRIDSGVYSTADRRFQVERAGSVGEWDSYTDGWVVMEYRDADAADNFNGREIFEAGSKRECVEWLDRYLTSTPGAVDAAAAQIRKDRMTDHTHLFDFTASASVCNICGYTRA